MVFGQLNARTNLASLTRRARGPVFIHELRAKKHGPTAPELPSDLNRLAGADLEDRILNAFAERLAQANPLSADRVASRVFIGLVHGPTV